MFSVSPIEPIVSLDDASVSQTDYQCASTEVCVIEDAAPVNATPVQDDTLTGEKITTSSVANRDALFARLGETVREESSPRDKIDMFESLVDRFSTSVGWYKYQAANDIQQLIHNHFTSNPSRNNEFSGYLQKFVHDAIFGSSGDLTAVQDGTNENQIAWFIGRAVING